MTAVPTMDVLTLKPHEWRAGFFSMRENNENSRSKRMHIYVSLLKQMAPDPEHLLATFAKLCAEILAAVSDGMLDIEDIILDSLFCRMLSKFLPEKRYESHPIVDHHLTQHSADIDEEGGDGGGASAAAARGRAMTQAVKSGLIQNTIPSL